MTTHLGAAVIERAIKDYRWSLIILHYAEQNPEFKKRKAYETALYWKKDCERFFKNQALVDLYCDWNGIRIMNLVKNQVNDVIKKCKPMIIPDNAMMGIKLEFDNDNIGLV